MPINEPCQIIFPTTLRVQGRYICAGDDEACKLYKLSHSLNYLIDTKQNVRIERLGVSEKEDNSDGSPATISHCHIFDLVCRSPDTVTPASFYAKHNEQNGLCSFALEPFRPSRFSSKKGFNFYGTNQSTPDSTKHSNLLFSAVPGKKRDVDYEWRNAERCLLATESDGEDFRSLMLHVKMTTEDRDALVSAWMLRTWWEQTEGNSPKHLDDMEDTRHQRTSIQGSQGNEIFYWSVGVSRAYVMYARASPNQSVPYEMMNKAECDWDKMVAHGEGREFWRKLSLKPLANEGRHGLTGKVYNA